MVFPGCSWQNNGGVAALLGGVLAYFPWNRYSNQKSLPFFAMVILQIELN